MRWSQLAERFGGSFLQAWADSHFDEAPRVTVTVGPGPPPILVAPAPVLTVGAAGGRRPELLVAPSAVVRVAPEPRAAWDERGWRRTREGAAELYVGNYVVRRGRRPEAYRGHILVAGGLVTPYIADPPAEIRSHRKGPCFQLSNPPWFRVHWQRPATNVDDALLYVERVLHEALN
jgi:hypothetical protein